MKVDIICRNPNEDRVIPRFARYLGELNGFEVRRNPSINSDIVYFSGYFDYDLWGNSTRQVLKSGYMTHREEHPPNSVKAKNFDRVGGLLDLRVTTAKKYNDYCNEKFGRSILIGGPVDHSLFKIPEKFNENIAVGFSGFQYGNGRKNYNNLAQQLVQHLPQLTYKASGNGWPCPTTLYRWQDLPEFFQSLDLWVMTANVEGIPMPLLESLASGVSVVVPRGVGIVDELPEIEGVYRYDKDDFDSLVFAVNLGVANRFLVQRSALRDLTANNTISNWQQSHKREFEKLLDETPPKRQRGIRMIPPPQTKKMNYPHPPKEHAKRGIYVVALGQNARERAKQLIATCREHIPEIPIMVVVENEPISNEDFNTFLGDSDVGGRYAKLSAYKYTPAEWDSILYLDADTEIQNDNIRYLFELVESGWQLAITKDPENIDTLRSFARADNAQELEHTQNQLGTTSLVQLNGGVWAFGRHVEVEEFFNKWLEEWQVFGMRDQAALIRALHENPLRYVVVSNHFNRFDNHSMGINDPVLVHYPGSARSWKGFPAMRYDDPNHPKL